jgi:cytochrome P450
VTTGTASDVYYDPYDVDIDQDPYPVFRRLREEAPLYYNEPHDFYAVSRFEDVERGLVERDTFISGRGGILELIKANIEMPPGVVIFEDPPTHTIHRSLLSRVFTPKKVAALEPRIRGLCVQSLDPFVGRRSRGDRSRPADRDSAGRTRAPRARGHPSCGA